MNELSPQARAIVDAARELDGPSSEDRTRNRTAVFAQVGIVTGVAAAAGSIASTAGAGTATVAGTGATTSAGAGAMTAVATGPGGATALLLVKVAAGLTIVGSLGVAVGKSTRSIPAPTAVQAKTFSTPVAPAPAREASIVASAPATPVAGPQSVKARAPVRAGDAVGAFSPLSEETRMLRAVNDARLAGNPGGALALLDSYAAEFPHGSLREEAAAARVLVLCDAGRADARAAAIAFLRDYPQSPLTARVRHACGGVRLDEP